MKPRIVCKLCSRMYHLCAVVGMEPASKASASLQVDRESAASCRDADSSKQHSTVSSTEIEGVCTSLG